MGRPSNREQRRRDLVGAFARVMADHGYAGATIAAVAREADVSTGLIHHHFRDKDDLLVALVGQLMAVFRRRLRERGLRTPGVEAYIDAALALDETTDKTAARCWVGVFAEAVRDPGLFARVRRLLDREVTAIQRCSRGRLSEADASALLAFILGALVFGAFAPRKVAGFAAPAARRLAKVKP